MTCSISKISTYRWSGEAFPLSSSTRDLLWRNESFDVWQLFTTLIFTSEREVACPERQNSVSHVADDNRKNMSDSRDVIVAETSSDNKHFVRRYASNKYLLEILSRVCFMNHYFKLEDEYRVAWRQDLMMNGIYVTDVRIARYEGISTTVSRHEHSWGKIHGVNETQCEEILRYFRHVEQRNRKN